MLFDGLRSPAERLAEARSRWGEVTPEALHEAAIDLAIAGLLHPGTREPLPAPGQVERDPWGRMSQPLRRDLVPLSTLIPGTLAQPGLPGSIAGNFGGQYRGAPDAIDHRLKPYFFAALGRWTAWPALHARLGAGVLLLVIGLLFAMWGVHHQVARDLLRLWPVPKLVTLLVICAAVNNLAAQSARLAAIHRYTRAWPAFGWIFALRFVPRLHTSTEGAAEHAGPLGRSRILLAPLGALLLLVLLAQLGWFLTRQGPGVLPHYFIAQSTASLVLLLYSANPLARRDGYFWLSHRLGVPDLREQAWLSLFNSDRPWNERKPVSRRLRLTYAALVIGYFFVTLLLYFSFSARPIEQRLGGPGVLLFVALFSFSMYRQSRRGIHIRTSLEPFRVKLPKLSRTTKIVAGVLVVLSLLPYPYEPGGGAVVLPHDRAELRALVAGDVRQVLVQEGAIVKAGQDLLLISDIATRAAVAAAEANLKRMQSELAIVKTGGAASEVQLSREKLATARKRLEFAQAEANRIAQAYQRRAISPQEYDTARGAAAVRKQEVMEAEQQLKLIGNPARDERVAALEAEVVRARTELDFQKEELRNTHVQAPIAGRVVSDRLLFARGVYLNVGASIGYIEDAGALQAEIKLPEATVGGIVADAPAWLRVWAFPGRSFKGHVTHIAPDAEQGEYGKVVRVRMALEETLPGLKPEMTGQAKVRSHWTLAGVAFTRALVRFVLVEMWSWLP